MGIMMVLMRKRN